MTGPLSLTGGRVTATASSPANRRPIKLLVTVVAAHEGQILVLRHGRRIGVQDVTRAAGTSGQQVDHRHRHQLGGQNVGQVWVGDAPVIAEMLLAFSDRTFSTCCQRIAGGYDRTYA